MNFTTITSGGGILGTENADDELIAKNWDCYIYVRTPKGIMYDNIKSVHYKVIDHVYVCYDTTPSTYWGFKDCKKVIVHYTFTLSKPTTGPAITYSPVAFSQYNTFTTCENIYECFDFVYENKFRHALFCDNTNFPQQDEYSYGVVYRIYYVAYSSGGTAFYFHAWNSHAIWNKHTFVWYYSPSFYYECNPNVFNPFYRDEFNNEMQFNSNIEVARYTLNIETSHNLSYMRRTKDSGYILRHVDSYFEKIIKHENHGAMYVHMECYR